MLDTLSINLKERGDGVPSNIKMSRRDRLPVQDNPCGDAHTMDVQHPTMDNMLEEPDDLQPSAPPEIMSNQAFQEQLEAI